MNMAKTKDEAIENFNQACKNHDPKAVASATVEIFNSPDKMEQFMKQPCWNLELLEKTEEDLILLNKTITSYLKIIRKEKSDRKCH